MAKVVVDVSGLANAWENDPEIRGRIRNGGTLLHPETKDKILVKTGSLNGPVLRPICEMMAAVSDTIEEGKVSPSPAVEDLREEVKTVMEMGKQEVTFQQIDKVAWTVRKFIAFLKLKIRKREVSTEPSKHVNIIVINCLICLGVQCFQLKVMSKLKRAFEDPTFQQLIVILDPHMQASCSVLRFHFQTCFLACIWCT